MAAPDLARLKRLKDTVAVVGVGDTDYLQDYRSGPRGNVVAKGSRDRDPYALAATALRRALDDAGLDKRDIDGICVSGQLSAERASGLLGINPGWCGSGDAPRAIVEATMAINAGLCTTVACVYATAQRSVDTPYGGPRATNSADASEAPWGMTSLGGLYAMMFERHSEVYGTTEAQLGAVSVAFARHASMNPNAIRQQPITIEDYMSARYVAEPLRLPDYCLINDGGVALIIQRADIAKDGKQAPINVSGFGWNELNADAPAAGPRLKDFYATSHQAVRDTVYPMSGYGPKDVDVYATFDSFSAHLLFSLEGFGFCNPGESGAFVQGGRIEVGGEIPCNTSGGMLSESSMQGWNHQVELVRQLRGGLGRRQVEHAEIGQYAHNLLGRCLSVIYTKGL